MAKVITQEALDAAIAKAVAKNTKSVLKAVGEVVKNHIGEAASIEDKAAKKAVTVALKAVATDVKVVEAA